VEITNFLQGLLGLVIWPYMVIFILISSGIKKYLGTWLTKITKAKWQNVYTVLIIATILGILYSILLKEPWDKLLLTYALGTTFYETILCHIEDFIIKK